MSISRVGATPEPQQNNTLQKNDTNQNSNESIFSKYDFDKDGKVDADEQRIALIETVSGLYRKMQKNMNEITINLITKFSKSFEEIIANGNKQDIDNIDKQIDNMLNKRSDDIINLITNGKDRTKDFVSSEEFLKSEDLQEGDYCVSENGYIYRYNGKNKNWSLYDGS